jgi:hypothetical protein
VPEVVLPQKPEQRIQIIPEIFAGKVISCDFGKLATKAKIEIADPWHYQADHNSSP